MRMIITREISEIEVKLSGNERQFETMILFTPAEAVGCLEGLPRYS